MSDLEESGEVTFRPSSQQVSSPSFDDRNTHAPTGDISANVSENANASLVRVLQDQFACEFAKIDQRIREQFVSIREEIDGKLGDLQDDIFRLKQEPQNLWEQDYLRAREIRDTPSYPIQSHLNMDNIRDQQSRIDRGHYNINRSNMGDYQQLPHIDRFSTFNMNWNGNGIMPTRDIPKERAKPRVFDGNEDFDDYLSQFEIVADLNNWDYRTKSIQLAGHLAKDACGMLGELSPAQRRDYDTLVAALKRRFGAIERSEMFRAKLKTRVRGNHESISELGNKEINQTSISGCRAKSYRYFSIRPIHRCYARPRDKVAS